MIPHDLPHVREALEAALAMVHRELAKPCNHQIGEAREVKRLIVKGLAELNVIKETRGNDGESHFLPPLHEWKDNPGVKTTPVKCLLCDSEAVVIAYAPHGCTCSPNKYQPRCVQHLHRAWDTDEDITIVEDFILSNTPEIEDQTPMKGR